MVFDEFISFKSLSALLKFYRVKAGLTQTELADAVGVSRSAVAMYESGQRLPSRRHCRLLAAKLGIDLSKYFYLFL